MPIAKVMDPQLLRVGEGVATVKAVADYTVLDRALEGVKSGDFHAGRRMAGTIGIIGTCALSSNV